MTRLRRGVDPAAAAVAHAAQLADDWGRHGPPRRPRNGHTANCPRQPEPVRWGRRCGLCWAESNGRPEEMSPKIRAVTSGNAISAPEMSTEMSAPLSSCRRCYAPTTNPEGHCT